MSTLSNSELLGFRSLAYNRFESDWPLADSQRGVSKVRAIIEEGQINCQLVVHVALLTLLAVDLPSHYRSKELAEDDNNFRWLNIQSVDGELSIDEPLEIGDVLVFSRKGELGRPELYHLAVVYAVDEEGNHRVAHAVSRKSAQEPTVLSFKIGSIPTWKHREFVGVRRVTEVGRETFAFADSALLTTLLNSFNQG